MRTADEMVDFCVEHETGSNITKGMMKRHFVIIEKQLQPDENVEAAFMGLHNYISPTNHNSNWAYAVTPTRIIMAQKKVIGEQVLIVNASNINDIYYKTGLMWGTITFDTRDEKFGVGVMKSEAKSIHEMVSHLLLDKGASIPNQAAQEFSAADEILKFKELMDAGVITEDEFETKKKELLGL